MADVAENLDEAKEIPSLEEAQKSYDAAVSLLDWNQLEDAGQRLLALYGSDVLTPELKAKVQYSLGEYYRKYGDEENARRFYNEAKDGTGEGATKAKSRLAELASEDSAQAAATDGVSKSEFDDLIKAGKDAMAREDYGAAFTHFTTAYSYPDQTPEQTVKVNLHLGRCYRRKKAANAEEKMNNYGLAVRHLEYARSVAQEVGDAKRDGKARAELEEISGEIAEIQRIEQAGQTAADGVQASEIVTTFNSANAAFRDGFYDETIKLCGKVLQAEIDIGPPLRASCLFNIGQAYIQLGEFEQAREYLEKAKAIGVDRIATRATERLALLDGVAGSEQYEVKEDFLHPDDPTTW